LLLDSAIGEKRQEWDGDFHPEKVIFIQEPDSLAWFFGPLEGNGAKETKGSIW